MGNAPGTYAGCVAAVTTLVAAGVAVAVFNPVGALALTAFTVAATLGPPACIVAGILYDWRNDKRKAAKKKAEEAASQAARRQAEERARQEARRQAEERARQEARRQAAERARQEARREAAERARQEEARRQAAERARQEAARRQAAERARQEEARRQAEERAREEARREAAERARQDEARRQAAERERQDEARRQAAERARQEEARRQAAERARQEAARAAEERCIELTNRGIQSYREGWQAESDFNSKLADVKFELSYDQLTEACLIHPSNSQAVKWRELCRLKRKGNLLFNVGIKLQGEGGNSCQEALVRFREAKEAYCDAYVISNDTGFLDCIALVDECVEATNEALQEANNGEREVRTERRGSVQLIGVVDHNARR